MLQSCFFEHYLKFDFKNETLHYSFIKVYRFLLQFLKWEYLDCFFKTPVSINNGKYLVNTPRKICFTNASNDVLLDY